MSKIKSDCVCMNKDTNEHCKIHKNEGDEYILLIEGSYDFQHDFQEYNEVIIEYCPFCGKKLES